MAHHVRTWTSCGVVMFMYLVMSGCGSPAPEEAADSEPDGAGDAVPDERPPSVSTTLALPIEDPPSAAASEVVPASPPELLGAAVLAANPAGDPRGAAVDSVERFIPDPVTAGNDNSAFACGALLEESSITRCSYGATDPSARLVLTGDSHAAMWTTAFKTIAESRSWSLELYTKQSCPAAGAVIARNDVPDETCTAWNAELEALLVQDPPDFIVFTGVDRPVIADGAVLSGSQGEAALATAYADRWNRLIAAGSHIVALADVPRPGIDVPECVAQNPTTLTACAVPQAEALATGRALRMAAGQVPEATYVDLTAAICPTDPCAAVIGDVIVYRDTNHLTDTYVRTLTPRLNEALTALDE